MSSARRNMASPGCSVTTLRKKMTKRPMSPGNWPFRRGMSSANTLLPGVGVDSAPAKLWSSFFTCARSSSLADLMSSSFEFMSLLNVSFSACFSSSSDFELSSTAASNFEATSSPTRVLKGLTAFKKYDTSFRGLKPHIPSKGVIAIVISGLWLSSLYSLGFFSCSCRASFLFGCAWIESAFCADRTLNRKGSFSPNFFLTSLPMSAWLSLMKSSSERFVS